MVKCLTPLPYLMGLGASNDEKLAYDYGKATALEACSVGANWTYSPVADLNINKRNPLVNVRSVSDNPDVASRLLKQVVKGMQENGLSACAKDVYKRQALQIPQYIAFSNFGIKDTYWIWFLTCMAGSPGIVFLYKQYIESIPSEIEEAAFIDGCGFFRIITQIYMPICKSILAVGLFRVFIGGWGNYMTPYMFLTEKKYPLSIALFNASYTLPSDPTANLDPIKCAAALLYAIPSICVFFLCQKQLVAGLTAGSVKG